MIGHHNRHGYTHTHIQHGTEPAGVDHFFFFFSLSRGRKKPQRSGKPNSISTRITMRLGLPKRTHREGLRQREKERQRERENFRRCHGMADGRVELVPPWIAFQRRFPYCTLGFIGSPILVWGVHPAARGGRYLPFPRRRHFINGATAARLRFFFTTSGHPTFFLFYYSSFDSSSSSQLRRTT